MANKYCQSCHLLPDPSMLDTKSWETGVLPNMGPRLGIFNYGFKTYPSYRHDRSLDSNFYPSQPLLSLDEWQKLIDYYTATSPDSLPKQDQKQPIQTGLSLFTVQLPHFTYQNPTTSFVKINTGDSLYPLIISDVTKRNIYFFDRHLEIKDSAGFGGPIVNIDFSKSQMLVCNVGILNPNNGKFGKGQFININSNGKMQEDSIPIFDSLRRPVQLTSSDLNNDGKKDYLVCEFGNLIGGLSWMENTGGTKYTRHVLRSEPGVIRAYVEDINYDGLPDIWALFTQGQEGIFLFTNKGNGTFEQQQVLSFPAVYGSTWFELADFNKDGLQDIVYTCGDNADYSMVLKPYHGVYIFLNEGNNYFKQKYFFPMNGCYKAMARDFDQDGDLDIAAIAFFPDFATQPDEGFVYLKNDGNFEFEPFTIPECKTGRWLTMDAGDLDGDNKIDILLGNFSTRPSVIKSRFDWQKGPPFIFLKNINK